LFSNISLTCSTWAGVRRSLKSPRARRKAVQYVAKRQKTESGTKFSQGTAKAGPVCHGLTNTETKRFDWNNTNIYLGPSFSSLCLYTPVYKSMRIHTNVYTYWYTKTYTYSRMLVHHTYRHRRFTYTHIYTYMYIYVHMWIEHMYMSIHIHIHIYIYNIYICIQRGKGRGII
jgi:hypothetical protein